MEANTVATYAILITGALLLIVIAYFLLKAFFRGAFLLVKAVFDLLKVVFNTLYFLLTLVLIAGGLQITMTAMRSFPDHSLYRTAWAGTGVFALATGVLALALWVRNRNKQRQGERSLHRPVEEESAVSYNAPSPVIASRETEEEYWKRKEQEELERQFQLMKAKETEREQAYQDWVVEQGKKDEWRQERADKAERDQQYWDKYRREEH